jgi:hypothetical protein
VTVNGGGTFSPGSSPGTLTIGGLTMSSNSALDFELGNPARDHIVVTGGEIALAGTLKLSLLDGFTPTHGQSFPLFEGAISSITGAFDSIIAPTFNGLTPSVVQSAESVFIQVGEAINLPGDFNLDGAVDAADYVMWRKTDGTEAGFDTWQSQFGGPAGSGFGGTANATVPEPARLVLFIVATVGIRLRRRQSA